MLEVSIAALERVLTAEEIPAAAKASEPAPVQI
jgi:hypothetical protein